MKQTLIRLSLYLMSSLMACTDTIRVDVEPGETQLSVDGEITDQPGPYVLTLAETVSAYTAETPPAVTKATVIIADSWGMVDTLREVSAGQYQTRILRGRVGSTYTLTINTTKFGRFRAQTTIERPTAVDSLYGEYQDALPGNTTGGYLIKYDYTDQRGPGDRFRAKIYRSRTGGPDKLLNQSSDLIYVEDKYNDGQKITDTIGSRELFDQGDRVRLVLLSLTADAYQFLREMDAQTNNSGLFANPPANVRTNIINIDTAGKKAVGYFFGSAQTSRSWTVQ